MSLFKPKKTEDPAPASTGVKEYAPLDKQLYDLEAENLADIIGKPIEVYPTKSAVMYTEYADVLLAINFGGLEATEVADDTADVLDADSIEFEDNSFIGTEGTKYEGDLEPEVQDNEIPEDEGSDNALADDLLSENAEEGIISDTNQSSPVNNGIKNTEEGESMANVDEMVANELDDYKDTAVSEEDPSFTDEGTENPEAVLAEDIAEEMGAGVTGEDTAETTDTSDNEDEADVVTEDVTEDTEDTVPEDVPQNKKLVIPNDKPKHVSLVKVEEPEEQAGGVEDGVSEDANTEELPEFYTNNAQLVLLLRKMGILDVMEQLAKDDTINEVELLRATSHIRKLNTAYNDDEALAVTYLESKGVDFRKLVGENSLKYKAEQILFIGEKVSKGFEPIDAILDPAYTIAQMQCICELEERERGRINTMAFCTPAFSPSTMRQLADVYLTGADMSIFKSFATLTWHGVTLVQAALHAGITSFDEYKTPEGALDENKLYGSLKEVNATADSHTGKLGVDGLSYVF